MGKAARYVEVCAQGEAEGATRRGRELEAWAEGATRRGRGAHRGQGVFPVFEGGGGGTGR